MATRRPAPRPKRAGEEFARTHIPKTKDETENERGQFSKKPRFDVRNPSALAPDALEDDAFLEADEIGKRGAATKRNAVQVDGYGSDSSNEGFDGRAKAKVRGNSKRGGKGEEQDDMFANTDEGDRDGDEDEGVEALGKNKKGKNVRFLGEEEIEGQVAGSRSGGHVSADFSVSAGIVAAAGAEEGSGIADRVKGSGNLDSSDESSADEEERANIGDVDEEIGAGGKKAHAPKLDAFNMKTEQEEGRFDSQGNFVRKTADADAVHDSWLEGVSKREMKRAKEAEDRRDNERRLKQREDDALLTSDIVKSLIPHLERGETVLEALARLGKAKGKKRPKWKKATTNNQRQHQKKNQRNGAEAIMDNTDDANPSSKETEEEEEAAEDAIETKRKASVEAITSAADQLYTRGQVEIYETAREGLMRQWGRETGLRWVDDHPPGRPREDDVGNDVDETTRPPPPTTAATSTENQWEYRWCDARDGGEAHGPFEGSMIVQWDEAGYFGDGVEFRVVGEEGWRKRRGVGGFV